MEVKEAIKFLESIGYSASGYGNSYISGDIEKYETPTSLGVRFVEFRKLTELLKSLEAENKALKKENKVYKGMWEELPSIFEPALLSEDLDYMKEVMADTEKKYLGGGE